MLTLTRGGDDCRSGNDSFVDTHGELQISTDN